MHSVILTIHNGNRIIEGNQILLRKVLDGIIENTVGDYELLCMLDGCTDDSESIVDEYVENYKNINIKPIVTPDIFETRVNNVAFKNSIGEYVIVVQDDQVITEKGWNFRMQKPFNYFDDVFAVTSRCAHNRILNPESQDIHDDIIRDDRWCDILIHCDHANAPNWNYNLSRDVFAVRGSGIRGPLMINLEDLKTLNYLDEAFARCDTDDHELMFRAYKELGKVVGCYWIGVESKHEWSGSCHGGPPPDWHTRSHHKNVRMFYHRYKDILESRRIIDNRILKDSDP